MTGRALATFELNAWLSPVVSPAVLADQLPPSATILEQRPLPRGTEGSRVVGRLRATMLIIDSFLLAGTELTPDLLQVFYTMLSDPSSVRPRRKRNALDCNM